MLCYVLVVRLLYSPPDPHQDACSWILSEDNRRNFALISALPSPGIRQIRIHWLLNAVTVQSQSVLKIVALNLLLHLINIFYLVHLLICDYYNEDHFTT